MPFKTTNIGGVLQSQYEQDPRLLAALQGMQQGSSSAPVQSGWEGIARAMQGPINAYMAKKLQGEYQGKQQDQYGAIADILAPPPGTVSSGPQQSAPLPGGGSVDYQPPQIDQNPNRDAIMGALSSGMVKPEAFSTGIADKLGFGKAKDPIKLGKSDRLLDGTDPTKTLIDALPDEAKVPTPTYNRSIRRGSLDVSQHWDQTKGQYVDDGSGAHFKPNEGPTEDPVSPLSDPAIVNAAVRYNATGTLPPLGMGKQAASVRASILDRAALLATGKATPEQLVAQMSNYKANSTSLAQQTKQFNSIEQNANTAKNSLNLAIASAKAGGAGPTDSPVFNRWVQAGRVAVNGDPQVKSLQNHLSAFAEDYAKVMTANTSAAGATDRAATEAHNRLSAANSVDSLQKISAEMLKEMGGRHYAARAQIGAIQKQLGGGAYNEPQGVQTNSHAPAAAKNSDPLGIR